MGSSVCMSATPAASSIAPVCEEAQLIEMPDLTSPVHRQCLANHMGNSRASNMSAMQSSPTEVFNMADDSDDDESVVENLWAEGATPEHPESADGKCCEVPANATGSPLSTEEGDSPSTDCSEGGASNLQGDAWLQENCDGVTTRLERRCSAARGLARSQRQVADAVLSQLQVDLELQVQRAVNQIQSAVTSWVSEEVTFARQGTQEEINCARHSLEETVCRAADSWTSERNELQSRLAELDTRVEKLQASLDAQMHVIVVQEDSHRRQHSLAEAKLEELQENFDLHWHSIARLEEASKSRPSDTKFWEGSAELQFLRRKVNEHEAELSRLPDHFQADLRAMEECSLRSLEELSNSLRAELHSKAPLADMHEVSATLHKRADEVSHAQQAMFAKLSRSVKDISTASLEKDATLARHEDCMDDVRQWLAQPQCSLNNWMDGVS